MLRSVAVVCIFFTVAISRADTLTGGPYSIKPLDINCGGDVASAGPYTIVSSIAQNGGTSSAYTAPYAMSNGFWHAEQGCVCTTLGTPIRIYVDKNATSGANDGSSWSNAYTSLQAALGNLPTGCLPLFDVWVADGTYTPGPSGDRHATFLMQSGLAIYGGFAGLDSTEHPGGETDPSQRVKNADGSFKYVSILTGDIDDNDTRISGVSRVPLVGNNSYHVVTASGVDRSAVLDGFTVTGGNANGPSPDDCGGGLFAINGSPTIVNCVFAGNNAGMNGGGFYIANGGSPVFTHCVVTGNTATNGAGGHFGTGTVNPTLDNCTFSNNLASGNGGAVVIGSGGAGFSGCSFSGNQAGGQGGGIYCNGGSATITNSTFAGNIASQGGGIYNGGATLNLNHSSFSGNTGTANGGAVCQNGGSTTADNCIFWGNTSPNPNLTSVQIYGQGGTIAVSNSNVQNGYPGGTNIFTDDPRFSRNPSPGGDGIWGTGDDDMGDLSLQPGSPYGPLGIGAYYYYPIIVSGYITPGSPYISQTTTFDGSSSQPVGYITSWHWDFGDGDTADGMAVHHAYAFAGSYLVTLTINDVFGRSLSGNNHITVSDYPDQTPPTINSQPLPQTVPCQNASAVFTVGVSNATSMRWYHNGQPLANGGNIFGADSGALTINPALPADAGNYQVVASNSYATAYSNLVSLTFQSTIPADLDHDCVVGPADTNIFQGCEAGPLIPAPPNCSASDLDHDGDVDQSDFGVFQRCLSGSAIPADPNCGG